MPSRVVFWAQLAAIGALGFSGVLSSWLAAHANWLGLRSITLYAACIVLLVHNERLARRLDSLNELESGAGRPVPYGHLPRPGHTRWAWLLGALLSVVAIGTALLGEEPHWRIVRVAVLAFACAVLVAEADRYRRPARPGAADVGERRASAGGSRGAIISAWTLAIVVVGNALWSASPVWLAVRLAMLCVLCVLLLVDAHQVSEAAYRLESALDPRNSQTAYVESRGWNIEDDPIRDASWLTREILARLDVREGMRVADVGAGGGFFSLKLAERVGPKGAVFATDSNARAVARLRWVRAHRRLPWLRPVLTAVDEIVPARARVERALLANVYLFQREAGPRARKHLARLAKAIVPGGLLVIYDDWVHEAGWRPSPQFPPLDRSNAEPSEIVAWASEWFELEADVPLRETAPPKSVLEKTGFLLVLRRKR